MMTQMKERAVELIERIPDEKMLRKCHPTDLQIRNRQWKHSRMC